jgi:hypothetical protein
LRFKNGSFAGVEIEPSIMSELYGKFSASKSAKKGPAIAGPF